MGIRIARGMNCEVTAISRSNAKEKIARGAGAQNFVATSNAEEMAAAARSLDIILDTVPAGHPAQDYLSLLDVDGKLVILGIDLTPYSVSVAHLLMTRVSFTSSLIGGIERTQACLKFCLEKGIECDTEVIPCTEINTAFKNLREGNDSAKRYVLDMKNTIGVLCEECTPGTDS
jgi:D-arabinose 1-dehydrogenase-like Zn-dependent alcohol dehydrogenase